MTAKERAEKLMRWANLPQNSKPLSVLIADEITAAEERGRLQEREACRDAVLFSNSATQAIEKRGGLTPVPKHPVLKGETK